MKFTEFMKKATTSPKTVEQAIEWVKEMTSNDNIKITQALAQDLARALSSHRTPQFSDTSIQWEMHTPDGVEFYVTRGFPNGNHKTWDLWGRNDRQ